MRILPITISADLIPPTMADQKLRTRRVINPRTPEAIALLINMEAGCNLEKSTEELIRVFAPYDIGDILYVREEHYVYGHWMPDGYTASKKPRPKFKFKPIWPGTGNGNPVIFPDAENAKEVPLQKNSHRQEGWYKRLARFMPKKYARTFLEVTDLRAEHLHDITQAEAVLEGIGGGPITGWCSYSNGTSWLIDPRDSFQTLWEKINGPGSWQENNWVWVISFKRVDRPANFLS